MADLDIPAARAICEAATPGPWSSHQEGAYPYVLGAPDEELGMERTISDSAELHPADATFIAAARTGWPAALDEIERLRGIEAERESLRLRRLEIDNRAGWTNPTVDDYMRENIAQGERLAQAIAERDAARASLADSRARVDTMIALHDDVERERDAARAEMNRMRPVVEAAKAWEDARCDGTRRICRETVEEHDDACPVATTEVALSKAIDAAREVKS